MFVRSRKESLHKGSLVDDTELGPAESTRKGQLYLTDRAAREKEQGANRVFEEEFSFLLDRTGEHLRLVP